MNANSVYSFEVSVKDAPWGPSTVNAVSRGAAKYSYWRSVLDAWPDIPFTAIRAHKLGAPVTTKQFSVCAKYRGLPDLCCGHRVKVGEATGTIVGHNESANFRVLFDSDSPKYPGLELTVHPDEMTVL